jgi:hypothetical protein
MQVTVIGVSRSHSWERGLEKAEREREVASFAAPLSFQSGAQYGLAPSPQPQRLVHASAHSGKLPQINGTSSLTYFYRIHVFANFSPPLLH